MSHENGEVHEMQTGRDFTQAFAGAGEATEARIPGTTAFSGIFANDKFRMSRWCKLALSWPCARYTRESN